MRPVGMGLLLLFLFAPLLSTSAVSMSLNVLAAKTSLGASASLESPQVHGAAVLFTCTYSDASGGEVLNSSCHVVMDGRRNRAVRGGVAHTYGEIIGPGQHSWYCSCGAPGYESHESSPRTHTVLPAQESSELKLQLVDAVTYAENALAQAKENGEDVGSAEETLSRARAALEQGDFELANALLSNEDMFANAFNARDRITDLGLLLIPTFFLGVLVVVIIFILMRK